MRTSIELAERIKGDLPQVAHFIRIGGNMSIANALGRILYRDRAYLRLIVGLQEDDETRNRWFDVLDEAETHLDQIRKHMIDDRVAGIHDHAEWHNTYNKLFPDYLSAAGRVWGMTMFVLAPQVSAWLESIE